MNYVYGPYIEYDCVECGKVVKENAPKNKDRLEERIFEANTNPETRYCAGCFNWSKKND